MFADFWDNLYNTHCLELSTYLYQAILNTHADRVTATNKNNSKTFTTPKMKSTL